MSRNTSQLVLTSRATNMVHINKQNGLWTQGVNYEANIRLLVKS